MVKEYIETVRAPNPDIHIHLDDERFPIAPWISSEQKMKKSVGVMYSQPLQG